MLTHGSDLVCDTERKLPIHVRIQVGTDFRSLHTGLRFAESPGPEAAGPVSTFTAWGAGPGCVPGAGPCRHKVGWEPWHLPPSHGGASFLLFPLALGQAVLARGQKTHEKTTASGGQMASKTLPLRSNIPPLLERVGQAQTPQDGGACTRTHPRARTHTHI